MEGVKGYKVLYEDWTTHYGYCYGGVGTTHRMKGEPRICERGFHFCKELTNCFRYYSFNSRHRIAEVLAIGKVVNNGIQFCTNELMIIRELSWDEVLNLVNSGEGNTGIGNTGLYNAGRNNTGRRNTGYNNIGDDNAGFYNYGDGNSGYRNVGNYNADNLNRGNRNAGRRNIGDMNTGNENIGKNNAGKRNIGDCNTGYGNYGNGNSGNFNRGNYNTGDFNVGDHSAGIFCVGDNHPMRFFNQDAEWPYSRWEDSLARMTMMEMPVSRPHELPFQKATEDEKKGHPHEICTEYYLRVFIATMEMRQAWWDSLPPVKRRTVTSLPNFNADIFYQCTGIKVKETDSKEI